VKKKCPARTPLQESGGIPWRCEGTSQELQSKDIGLGKKKGGTQRKKIDFFHVSTWKSKRRLSAAENAEKMYEKEKSVPKSGKTKEVRHPARTRTCYTGGKRPRKRTGNELITHPGKRVVRPSANKERKKRLEGGEKCAPLLGGKRGGELFQEREKKVVRRTIEKIDRNASKAEELVNRKKKKKKKKKN